MKHVYDNQAFYWISVDVKRTYDVFGRDDYMITEWIICLDMVVIDRRLT